MTTTSSYRLISHHLCPYVQRAVIVLTEKAIAHERVYIDLKAKPDWFVRLAPLGKTPVLQAGDTVLFESQVIAEYLDEVTPGSLHPADPLGKARHRSWIEYGSETLGAIAGFYSAPDADAFDAKRRALREKLERIEGEIVRPWFDGDDFHLIDGVWGTIFRYFDVFDAAGDFGAMTGLPRVNAWRAAIMSRPSVRDAVPAGYPDRLRAFLGDRQSHLSRYFDGRSPDSVPFPADPDRRSELVS